MTQEYCTDYLRGLTDEELKKFADTAHKDTIEACTKEKDSEWHQSCFSALYMACTELNKRKASKSAK